MASTRKSRRNINVIDGATQLRAEPLFALVAESDADFADYLFERRNPRGVHFERWRHAFGCGKWFHVARDTATLEIFGSYPAEAGAPPEELVAAIRAKRPDWEGWA